MALINCPECAKTVSERFGLDLVEQCFALEVDGKRHSAKGSYRFER